MAYPYTISWPAAVTTYFVTGAAVVAATPLVLTLASPVQNIFTGALTYNSPMPAGNLRTISLTSTSNLSGVNFVIVGTDYYGNTITETKAGPNVNTVYSVSSYASIQSITPSATNAGVISIGTGIAGFTDWYKLDVFNKMSSFTLTLGDVVATVSLTPIFSNDLFSFSNGVFTYNASATTFAFPVGNANVISSPSTVTTLPTAAAASFSLTGIPCQGICTQVVTSNTTGSFSQTIIQQGGKF